MSNSPDPQAVRSEQSAVVMLRTDSSAAMAETSGATVSSSSGVMEQSPSGTKVEVESYTLLAPNSMAPHFSPGEGRFVHYIYTGGAIRRNSNASPKGPMAAPKMEYVPDGPNGSLEFYTMEDVEGGTTASASTTSAETNEEDGGIAAAKRKRKDKLVTYVGDFQEGKKHGKGTLTVLGRWKLTCKWMNDVPELSQECLLVHDDDRTTYTGLLSIISNVEAATTRAGFSGLEWALHVRILPDGVGEMLFPDRRRYCGQWQCGQCHGFGVMIDPGQGTTFIGAFEFDVKHGSGTLYKEASGATFCGQWQEGHVNGAGGLHLKGNAFTVQGTGWNPGISEADEITIIKSRNVNGVWEPLFINFDNNLASALGEIPPPSPPPEEDNGPNDGLSQEKKNEAVVMKLMDALLARNDLSGLLAVFQRCFYFLYGSCGNPMETGGGPSYDSKGEMPSHPLLCWCASAGGAHNCSHLRGTRKKPITDALFQRALDDLASFTFSVRLRLQSFLSMHPAICEFDVGCGVLRLAFDRIHALVVPIVFNLAAVVSHNADAAHVLACRRCEERLVLKDFLSASLSNEGFFGPDGSTLIMDELEDAVYENCLAPIMALTDFDESEEAFAIFPFEEEKSLDSEEKSLAPFTSRVELLTTTNGVLMKFNGFSNRKSLQTLFYKVRGVVYEAARLCGSKVVPVSHEEPIDHGSSNLELFETPEQQLKFCRLLQFTVLQRISDTLFSHLVYLRAITTLVEPRYPTPCENDDPSAMVSSPSPRNNTDLFCLETLMSAISSSTTIYPSLRDMSFNHRPGSEQVAVTPEGDIQEGEGKGSCLVDPVLPLGELFNETRYCLGRGLFQAYVKGERPQAGATAAVGSGSEWSFFLSTRAELRSGDGTSSASLGDDGGPSNSSFHEEMDKIIDGEYQIEPFVMELLRTVDMFLRSSAEGMTSTVNEENDSSLSLTKRKSASRQRAVSPSYQNKNGAWLLQRDYIYEPPTSEMNEQEPNVRFLETQQATLQVKRIQELLVRIGINVMILPVFRKNMTNTSFGNEGTPETEMTNDSFMNATERQTTSELFTSPMGDQGEGLSTGESGSEMVPTGQVRISFRPMANNSCPLFVMQKLSSEWAHDLHTVEHLTRSRRRT